MGFNLQKNIHYSVVNSSTTPLGVDEVFTGEWEDVGAFGDTIISIATDANGSYQIQYSPDGVFTDSTLTRYHNTAEINPPHRFTNTRRFVRVVYTNEDEAQTYFRLQTSYGDRHPLNVPIDGTIAPDYDATVVRGTDYRYEVANGQRQGHVTFNKFGYNPVIDNGTPETIWAAGGTFTPLTTASTLTIVSSVGTDAASNTGASLIQIVGIDANRKTQTEVVTMTGTTPVVTTSTWLGVNRVAVALAGSSQSNDGNITVTATTGGATQAYVLAGQGVTQQCIFFNELQTRAMVDWLWINVRKTAAGTAARTTVDGWVYSPVSNGRYLIFRQNQDTGIENTIEIRPSQPFVLNAGDVFWLTGTTSVNGTQFNARFSLVQIRNADYDPDS